jgi:hypothetical protein|tara:strand:+ start:141 stop:383 length:243 start_codon:yes stop_codon:yes gene_type:complete
MSHDITARPIFIATRTEGSEVFQLVGYVDASKDFGMSEIEKFEIIRKAKNAGFLGSLKFESTHIEEALKTLDMVVKDVHK